MQNINMLTAFNAAKKASKKVLHKVVFQHVDSGAQFISGFLCAAVAKQEADRTNQSGTGWSAVNLGIAEWVR